MLKKKHGDFRDFTYDLEKDWDDKTKFNQQKKEIEEKLTKLNDLAKKGDNSKELQVLIQGYSAFLNQMDTHD